MSNDSKRDFYFRLLGVFLTDEKATQELMKVIEWWVETTHDQLSEEILKEKIEKDPHFFIKLVGTYSIQKYGVSI